ncbi:MAG TPA: hypothetical protein VGE52_02680, partial [Pirellulales bacterium]
MSGLPKFGIGDVLLLTIGCAVAFVTAESFGLSRYGSLLAYAAFLGVTTIGTLHSWRRSTPGEAFGRAFTIYCWIYLATVLLFSRYDERGAGSIIGMAGAFLTAVVARWSVLLFPGEPIPPLNRAPAGASQSSSAPK